MKTLLGLDLGIASIGWCLFDCDDSGQVQRIKDINSFVFNQIEDGKTGNTENIIRRTKRLMRRQRRRKQLRLSDLRNLFNDSFGLDFFEIERKRNLDSPIALKVKGLTQKLSKEELMIALYHYVKYRGFSSNRKVEDESAKESDTKKMLSGINKTSSILKEKNITISTYLLQQFKDKPINERRYHNSDVDYLLTVSREMYLDEIKTLLKKQKSFGLIDDDFINRYISIFERQRDFSEGPDASSKYHVDIEKRIGLCAFDNQPRACKDSYAAMSFVLLSSLNNFKYKDDDGEYKNLSSKQIKDAFEVLIRMKKITYASLFKTLKIKPKSVKGLYLTKKQYRDLMTKIDDDSKNGVVINYDDEYSKKLFSSIFFKNSETLVNLMKTIDYKKTETLDEIATILLYKKTDKSIEEECRKRGYSEKNIESILKNKSVSQTINLSINICQKLIPILLEGYTYDKALNKLGYLHSEIKQNNVIGTLPEIEEALSKMGKSLLNPVVKHTLVNLRKVILGIIKVYGPIDFYTIEMTREIKKNWEDRKDILNDQKDNMEINNNIRIELLEKFPHIFHKFKDIKHDDIVKYKLFNEQKGFSPYTNVKINENQVFDDDLYEIDHIFPFSRSFDDSFKNKVLVEAEENRKKGSRIPTEHYHDLSRINAFLSSNYYPREKAERLLAKTLPDRFANKDFSDTSYITKLAKDLLSFYMVDNPIHVRTISGFLTDKLRDLWHLSGKTHSYLSSNAIRYALRREYTLQSFTLSEKGDKVLTFVFNVDSPANNSETQETFDVCIKEVKPSKSGVISIKGDNVNKAINYVYQNDSLIFQNFFNEKCHGKTINEISEMINKPSTSVWDSEFKETVLFLLNRMFVEIQDDKNAKDRSNDLHHALDAAVIGAATPGTIRLLTNYFKNNEDIIDSETGEIKTHAPLPYDGFTMDVLVRVYERDEDTLLNLLNELPAYKKRPLSDNDVHVLVPTRLPSKNVKGPISNETIYGIRNNVLTKRTAVSKLTDKNIIDIYDREKGNNAVFNACVNWLANKNGQPYPLLPKKGSPIKSVLLIASKSKPEEKVNLSNNRFAENSDVVRVNVYKKKNIQDQRLYFAGVFYNQIAKESIRNRQLEKVKTGKMNINDVILSPNYILSWAQGENKIVVNKEQLNNEFILVASLPRYSLIEISFINSDKKNLLCYSGGFSSGMFEIYSLIGDGTDLVSSGNFSKTLNRYQVTVSTIKNIKVKNISTIGRIS